MVSSVPSLVLDTLDQARRALLTLRWVRALASDRELRIATRVMAAVIVATATAVLIPGVAFALGPLLLGIPHVVSDLRHMVVRREVSSAQRKAVAFAALALASVRLGQVALGGSAPLLCLEVTVGVALMVTSAARGGWERKAPARAVAMAVAVLAVGVLAMTHASVARVWFAPLHNLLAIGVWLTFFRARWRCVALPLLVGALCLGALLGGSASEWTSAHGVTCFLGVRVEEVARWLAPGLDPARALRTAQAHGFLDSVHYGVWLAWVPDEDADTRGTLTFRMSARSALRDLGARPIKLAAGLWCALLTLGALRPALARSVYYAAAGFHGYVEAAMAAYLLGRRTVGGRAPRASSPLR